MYKVLRGDLSKLQQRINAIERKLDKHGLTHEFKIIKTEIEPISVYAYSPEAGTIVKVRTIPAEVVTYDFKMETLKLGDWTPIAVIEHMESGNMVYPINNATLVDGFYHIKSNCEHCNTDRQRNKTVILMNAECVHKQVGSTCVKDFTGIDANTILGIYASVNDILEKDVIVNEEYAKHTDIVETRTYLAASVELIKKRGYKKDITKNLAYELAKQNEPGDISEQSFNKADEIINYYTNAENLGAFSRNIQIALRSPYSKMNGFVAHAPVVYEKHVNEVQQTDVNVSSWQGYPKDKITVSVKHQKSITLDGYYGTCFIHLFEDNNGNVYKWNTSKALNHEVGTRLTLSGTVKEHDTYEGVKQTVLTRCKYSVAG